MIRFCVTGSPRSGTKWTAHTLTKVGLWCTHEEPFSGWASDYGDTGAWRDTDDADSSWLAAPHTPALRDAGIPVVGLLRHPELVAQSLVRVGFFTSGQPYLDYIAAHAPDCFDHENPTDRALRFWMDWTTLVEADVWWPLPAPVPAVWAFADQLSIPTHDLVEAFGPVMNRKPTAADWADPSPQLVDEATALFHRLLP